MLPGCDIIELGIPFSDPLADGVTIQNASFRALQNGVTPEVTLSVLYLDKGDCKVSLIYDSCDDVVRVRARAPGALQACEH